MTVIHRVSVGQSTLTLEEYPGSYFRIDQDGKGIDYATNRADADKVFGHYIKATNNR